MLESNYLPEKQDLGNQYRAMYSRTDNGDHLEVNWL